MKEVSALCDRELGPERDYRTYLHFFRAILDDMKNRETSFGLTRDHRDLECIAIDQERPNCSHHQRSSASQDTKRTSLTSSVPTTPMSSFRGSHRDSNFSNGTQSTSIEVSPSSTGAPYDSPLSTTVSPPRIAQVEEHFFCGYCAIAFTGRIAQDRRSNLKRHMRYKHGDSTKFTCSYPNCDRSYSRPDAVHKHRREGHRPEESQQKKIKHRVNKH